MSVLLRVQAPLISLALVAGLARGAQCPAAASTLAQSLPVGGGTWSLAPGAVDTHTALIDLVNQSENTLDFTAMYMDLIGTAGS